MIPLWLSNVDASSIFFLDILSKKRGIRHNSFIRAKMKVMKNINRLRFLAPGLFFFLIISLAACHSSKPDATENDSTENPTEESTEFAFAPLGFPIAQPNDIVYMAAFGIPNWSGTEPHNGIDLVIAESLAGTRIISPTIGVVRGIAMSENPYSHPPGQLILTITVSVNSEWTVSFIIEPGTCNADMKTAQRNAVLVAEGQKVMPGDPLADLLVGEIGHPCLHFMVSRGNTIVCAYLHSSPQAQSVYDEIVRTHPDSYLPNSKICYLEEF